MRNKTEATTQARVPTIKIGSSFGSAERTPRFKKLEEVHLALSYEELQEKNLAIREKVEKGIDVAVDIKRELAGMKSVKAVTVYFTDLEGKLHGLDYDKDHVLDTEDNLTFDGSSINGFSTLDHSDLRLSIDWSSFRWTPADVFGAGKVIVFADISDQDGKAYEGDFRSKLKGELSKLRKEQGVTMSMAPEIEGFLLEGVNAEKRFDPRLGMQPASKGGYYNSLPQDGLRIFIDHLAEATRAMGFKNEKDHPEVAPGQFELNYKHRDALHAADQILLYKLVARQIAANMECTASFLPKPIAGINGSGMHCNISLQREGRNLFYDAAGSNKLSEQANMFIAGVLNRGTEMCLAINSSVNSYRRLDPNFEAPNEVKVSASDRGSMVRVPLGNEKSARMEVRTVAPDANPYLVLTLILQAGLEGMVATDGKKEELIKLLGNDRDIEILPSTIQEAITEFKKSEFIEKAMGPGNKVKFLELKQVVADRSPKTLGIGVKNWEILDHHEVRNQSLSNNF